MIRLSAAAAAPTTWAVRIPSAVFGVTVLASAFLLFLVQPLIAKSILPWFGGSRRSGRPAWCSSRWRCCRLRLFPLVHDAYP